MNSSKYQRNRAKSIFSNESTASSEDEEVFHFTKTSLQTKEKITSTTIARINSRATNLSRSSHPTSEFQRVSISEPMEQPSDEIKYVCSSILRAARLRKKYVYERDEPNWGGMLPERFFKAMELCESTEPPFKPCPESKEVTLFDSNKRKVNYAEKVSFDLYPDLKSHNIDFKLENGIFKTKHSGVLPSKGEFFEDLVVLLKVVHNAAVKSVTFKRLKLMEALFGMHILLNSERESLEQKQVPHRDFYNIRKVDTHIHHSAVMNQKHLLRFIKHKLKHKGEEIVTLDKETKQGLTLNEVFSKLDLTSYDLSIDTLDMHADNTFHRFDRFNLKYNPIGDSQLREIFLKTDNHIRGRYLADVTKEVFQDLSVNKYVYIEPRISVYGKDRSEFFKLGNWWFENKLFSPHTRFMIQVPRLYKIYKRAGIVQNFVKVLPEDWSSEQDPPYSYWLFYLSSNLKSLNRLRASLGLSTFEFRPHAGEAGDLNNLAAAFLTTKSINHGILLRKAPALQYLYYLCQVGLAISPLSNNKLFLDYHSNPFPQFFARGLNVSLSTDDPLMLHITKEPLVEEYSCAAQVWKLSSTDLSEIARNSVLQSGFEHPYKAHFLGKKYLDGTKNEFYKFYANDIHQTNVPDIRVKYRRERLENEWNFVLNNAEEF
eukprot:snap_masked-scaffold_2-processed-gene-27.19-mRNA-1 protein AED:0.11 eAED:0.11 QI:0/0/0/0.71/1/1/7/0/655